MTWRAASCRGWCPAVSVVDARDVALAQIAAAERGRRGERYLAAGRHMEMGELIPLLGQVAGIPVPTRKLPLSCYALAAIQEVYARITGKPVLLGLATVRLMVRGGRTRFNPAKSEHELGLHFRPLAQTLADTVGWYRQHGWFWTGSQGRAPARPWRASAMLRRAPSRCASCLSSAR